jgi:hypothetical protein
MGGGMVEREALSRARRAIEQSQNCDRLEHLPRVITEEHFLSFTQLIGVLIFRGL